MIPNISHHGIPRHAKSIKRRSRFEENWEPISFGWESVPCLNDCACNDIDVSCVRRIIVFNHCGVYDGLKRHIREAVDAGYVVASNAEAVVWCDTVAEVVAGLKVGE